METVLKDFRHTVRTLRKNPTFTVVALVALALGVGANSAIFSVVDAVLLKPLPFARADRLLIVTSTNVKRADASSNVSYPDFVDWRERNRSFDDMAAFVEWSYNVTAGDEPEHVHGAAVSASLFSTLGAGPALGRVFTPEEDRKGGAPVVVIGDGFWRRRFGADPAVIGRTVVVDGAPTTVVGVMPAGFQFPVGTDPVDVWKPVGAMSLFVESRGARFLAVVARLRDGVTAEQAKADLDAVAAELEQQYPESNAGYAMKVQSLADALFGDVRTPMLMLLAAVGFVLLIACANVANLLLARALSRHKEIAIRAALGASRWRLARQMLTESLVLSLAGGAIGLVLAVWGSSAIAALVADQLPRARTISVDARVVAFTFAVSVLTGVLFGLAPALRLARTDPNDALVDTTRGATEGVRHNRVRSLLVVSEVALSVVLLVGAGLMIRSFVALMRVDTGFKTAHVLTTELTLPGSVMDDDPFRASRFFDDVLARVRALPGVTAAGATTTLPMSGADIGIGFSIAGKTSDAPGEEPSSPFDAVSPDYFRAMGIPVLAGREFTDRDTEKSPPVVLVSEALARRYWPGEDPIGKRIRPGYSASKDDDEEEAPEREIVGVVGDVKHDGLQDDTKTAIYAPLAQTPLPFASLVVVSKADPSSLAEAVRREVLAVDRNQPIANVRLLDRVVSDSVAEPRLYMTLLGIFAAVALVLTAIGIYGVVAYSVRRRTHEIGVRMALGATSGDVLGLVVRQGMGLVLVGVAAGAAAAFGVTRFMESLLFGVAAADPLTFGGVALLLAAFALLSIYLPARRAARLDPMAALREE